PLSFAQGGLGRAALGDIEDVTFVVGDAAVGVADDVGEVVHRHIAAVGGADAVFLFEAGGGGRAKGGHFVGHAAQIVGMNDIGVAYRPGEKMGLAVAELTDVGGNMLDRPLRLGPPAQGHDRAAFEHALLAEHGLVGEAAVGNVLRDAHDARDGTLLVANADP